MIDQPTVFVLGAGAHCSYGFPTGKTLKTKIIELVRAQTHQYHSKPERHFSRMINLGAATVDEMQRGRFIAFAESLERSGQASIDAFLNANGHLLGFQKIGKAAIAQILLDCENQPSSHIDADHWLAYLFETMLAGVKTKIEFIEKNKIGFVTFNYDRFLETWLLGRIQHSFGLDANDALEVLNKIPIHHVYGTLGPFPETRQDPWIEASQSIQTIYETTTNTATHEQAQQLLAKAHAICLLGFGFHFENIELLDLVKHVENCPGIVASSSFDITETEWGRYTKTFTPNKIHHPTPFNPTFKCLETLRHVPIF